MVRGNSVREGVALARHALRGLVATAALLPFAVSAQSLFPLPSGQSLTLGGASNPRTVQTAGGNPASPVTSDLGGFWFGLGSAGVGYEVGDFNELIKQVNDLKDDLDKNQTQPDESQVESRSNTFITSLNDKAHVKVFVAAQPPLLPMGGALTGLGGAFTLGITAITGARVDVMGRPNSADVHDKSDPYVVDGPTPTTTRANNCTGTDQNGCQFDADVGGYVKGAGGGVVSLGYSGGVLHRLDGTLYLGGRLNYNTVELRKGLVALGQKDSSGDNDVQKRLTDELDRHQLRSNKIGMDLGLLWAAYNFRAGATVRNVNEPSFKYPDIGQNCAPPSDVTPEQVDCRAAVRFSQVNPRVLLKESYKMKRQLQFETAVFDSDRTWSLAASYDANKAPDATGDDYQWLAVSGSFSPRGWGWLVPAVRAGYRKNQAGSGLDMVSAGLSLFRIVNLDVSEALDKIQNEGKEYPRSAMVNLSLELYF